MHEEALVRDLRRKLVELAEAHPDSRIVRVHMWVGALSHLTAPELDRRWTEATRGTAAEGSKLSIDLSSDLTDPRAQGVLLRDVTFSGGT